MATTSKVTSIIDALRTRITSGEFDEKKLPSFRSLVQEYNTSQETMNKAMQALQAEGLLLSSGAKGVFVNKSRIRLPGIIPNFYKFITEHGEKHGFEVTEIEIDKPKVLDATPAIAKAMMLPKNTKVVRRFRKQGSTQSMYRFAETYYPMTLITEEMLKNIKNDPHYHIVSNIEKNFGETVRYPHEEIIVRLPTAFEQEHLKIVRTNPVVEMTLTCYNDKKTMVVMYSRIIFNANHFTFTYDYKVDHWA